MVAKATTARTEPRSRRVFLVFERRLVADIDPPVGRLRLDFARAVLAFEFENDIHFLGRPRDGEGLDAPRHRHGVPGLGADEVAADDVPAGEPAPRPVAAPCV